MDNLLMYIIIPKRPRKNRRGDPRLSKTIYRNPLYLDAYKHFLMIEYI